MSKPGDKDWLPYTEHLKRLPKKRMASGVLFFNSEREVLIVKPNYKPDWILPGGLIELYESPIDAAIREVKEEMSLTFPSLEFIAVIHSPRRKENDDVVYFYFYGGVLTEKQITNIRLQSNELDEFRFVPIDKVSQLSKATFVKHLPKILTAIKEKRPVLIKNEE